MVDEPKKADARSHAESCGFGFKLLSKRTFAGEKNESVANICFCEGAKQINGPLPRLELGAEENHSIAR